MSNAHNIPYIQFNINIHAVMLIFHTFKSVQTRSENRSSENRKDHFSTACDPSQCSSYILDEHFILLNFRLDELFVEFKNARIEVRKRKLWPSKADATNSQGCAEIWAHPCLPFCSGFCHPRTKCSASNSPETP